MNGRLNVGLASAVCAQRVGDANVAYENLEASDLGPRCLRVAVRLETSSEPAQFGLSGVADTTTNVSPINRWGPKSDDPLLDHATREPVVGDVQSDIGAAVPCAWLAAARVAAGEP